MICGASSGPKTAFTVQTLETACPHILVHGRVCERLILCICSHSDSFNMACEQPFDYSLVDLSRSNSHPFGETMQDANAHTHTTHTHTHTHTHACVTPYVLGILCHDGPQLATMADCLGQADTVLRQGIAMTGRQRSTAAGSKLFTMTPIRRLPMTGWQISQSAGKIDR